MDNDIIRILSTWIAITLCRHIIVIFNSEIWREYVSFFFPFSSLPYHLQLLRFRSFIQAKFVFNSGLKVRLMNEMVEVSLAFLAILPRTESSFKSASKPGDQPTGQYDSRSYSRSKTWGVLVRSSYQSNTNRLSRVRRD